MDKTKIKSSCYLVILLVVFVVAWQLMANKGMINPLFFSSPEKVWTDIVEMFSTGYIFPHIQITLYASFVGLFYGILLGTIVALIVGENQVLARVIEGQDTELLYTCTDTYPYSFFLAKDVKSVADLKGTTVNGADSGSSPRAFVRAVVNNAGLDADNDVTYANMSNSAVIAALESGEIKATYASPELRAQLIDAGYDVTVDIYDKDVHKELLGSESYEMYIVFGKKSYVEQNPEITQSFINACYKGAQYLDSHDTDEIVDTLKEQFSEMTNLEQVVKECKDNGLWSPDGLFTDSGVEAINKMAMDSGLIDKPVAKSDLVDDSFAKKAAGK